MTVNPNIGAPDWFKPTPAVNGPVVNETYNDNAITKTYGPFNAVGFSHAAIVWRPITDQYMVVTPLDQNGAATHVNTQKVITARAQSIVDVVIPVILGQFKVDIFTISGGAPIQGNIVIDLFNGSDRRDLIHGVQPMNIETARAMVAGATVTDFPGIVAEGAANFSMSAQGAGVTGTVSALNTAGTYDFIAQLAPQGVSSPANAQIWVPARQLQIVYNNGTAGPIALYAALIIGG